MPHEPGAVVSDRYELGHQLSSGATSETYLATDRRLGRRVALRILRPSLAADVGVVERFRRAAGAVAAVRDPSIVAVYDYGLDRDTCFLATEYVEGGSLADELRERGALPVWQAVQIAFEIATALDVAHRAGVVHGGLKPRDVLLTAAGTVKVADFGTTAASLRAREGDTAAQTAMYLSPEQARGEPADARSDLYALGLVLAAMLTGEPVFRGDSAVDVVRQQVEATPSAPSQLVAQLPVECDAIVMRLLAKRPADRYQSATDLGVDLRALRDRLHPAPATAPTLPVAVEHAADRTAALPTVARATGAPTSSSPTARRTGWMWAAVAALLVAAFVVILVLAMRGGGQQHKTTPKQVAVAAVVGQRFADAARTLTKLGLSVSRVDEPNPDFGSGIVFDESPPAGKNVGKGSRVVLKVSTGPSSTTTTTPPTSASSTSSTTTSTTTTTTTTTSTATTTSPPTTSSAPATSST